MGGPFDYYKFGIRDIVCDQTGMLLTYQVFAAGGDKRRAGDGRQFFRPDVRLAEHHKGKRCSLLEYPGLEFLESRSAVRIQIGPAERNHAAGPRVGHLQHQGYDSAVAPTVKRGLVKSEFADYPESVFHHIRIMIFFQDRVGPLSAGIRAVNAVTFQSQLLGLGGHTLMRTAVPVHQNHRLAVFRTPDCIDQFQSVHPDSMKFLRIPYAAEAQRREIEKTSDFCKKAHIYVLLLYANICKISELGAIMKTIGKIAAVLAAIITACSCDRAPANNCKLLIGTYTAGSGSLGVYLYDFNLDSATATLLDTAAAGNPSFVIINGGKAYSVSEFSDGTQGVYSYNLGRESIDVECFRGGTGEDPCNLCIAGNYLLTADYTGGTLSAFPLEEDGGTGPLAGRFDPRTLTPDAPEWHIHCASLSPDGKYVFVTDLGADALYRCRVEDLPQMEFSVTFRFQSGIHPGPRHLTFSPDGRFAYLLGETGDLLTTFAYSDGQLLHLQTIEAYDGKGCGSADIHIGPDGRFLYTSHRLEKDGIAVFRIDSGSGLPVPQSYCPTGKHPRNFAITPDGKTLLCACRDSNRIEIYSIDTDSGALTFTGKVIEIPAPVCVRIF